MQIYWIKRRFLHEDKVQLPQKPFRSAPAWPLFRCNWRSWSHVKTPHKRSLIQVRARRVFPCNSINLRYDNRPYPYHLFSRQNQDMCDHEKWRKWRIFPLVRIMGKTVSFFDIECSVIDQFRYVKIHTALGSDAKGNWQTEEIIFKNYRCVIQFVCFIPANLVFKYDIQHIETWSSTQKSVNKCKYICNFKKYRSLCFASWHFVSLRSVVFSGWTPRYEGRKTSASNLLLFQWPSKPTLNAITSSCFAAALDSTTLRQRECKKKKTPPPPTTTTTTTKQKKYV